MTEKSPPSFESVYSQYTPLVRRLLRKQGVSASDLDDVLQETFVTVHRLLPSFEGRSSFSTWLHAVTWRIAANHRRHQRRTVTSSTIDVAAEPSGPEPELGRQPVALEQFEGEQRDLLALRDIGGLSISLLAELTGHARATVRNQLQRGRAALMRANTSRAERAEAYDRSMTEHFARPVVLTSAPDTRVLDDGLTAVTTVGNLVLALWRGPCTTSSLSEVLATILTHARNRPDGIRYLSVVEATSTPPDREGRDMILWSARQLKGKLDAVAHFAEGSVRISEVASIMNASILLARAGFDPHYFGKLKPAVAWLAQHGPLDSQLVTSQVAEMKQLLGPAPG